jgi:MYXO-CTERM domain-containing protein
MRKVITILALLAVATAAHAAVLQAPTEYPVPKDDTFVAIPIQALGTESNVRAITVDITLGCGKTVNWAWKGNASLDFPLDTVLQGSNNTADPADPYDALHIYADYAMNFADPNASLPGVAGYLVVDTTGLAVGTVCSITLSGDVQDSVVTGTSASPIDTTRGSGSFKVIPEPAAALLLLAGLPMLRRRK